MSASPKPTADKPASDGSSGEVVISPPRPSLQKNRGEGSASTPTPTGTVPRANPFIEHARRASLNQPRPNEIVPPSNDASIELHSIDLQSTASTADSIASTTTTKNSLSSVVSAPHNDGQHHDDQHHAHSDTSRVSLAKSRVQGGRFSIEEQSFTSKLVNQPVRTILFFS